MKSNITKIRDYNGNLSFGITKEISSFLKDKGFEHFVVRCKDNGVVTFTPLSLLTDKLDELEG